MRLVLCFALALTASACAPVEYDVVIRGGTIYDGSGQRPIVGDVAINGRTIAAVGALPQGARARKEIDARGLAVSPGFINMLSHSEESLIADGRGQSELRQGVTLEVLGEGSMGPINDAIRAEWKREQIDVVYDMPWSTLGGYLDWLEARKISPNVASFVGAPTIRELVIGKDNRAPSAAELDRMRAAVDEAMREGALGVSTALIYPPATYAKTEELIELAKVASRYGGVFAAHMRSEGGGLLEGIDEMLRIGREAKIPVEIYHLKVAGRSNWSKFGAAVKKIEDARAAGVAVTADMYVYTAGEASLVAMIPPWAADGGWSALEKRLRDPETRARITREIVTPSDAWENLYLAAGPEGIRLLGVKRKEDEPLVGKTLAEIARARGQAPEEAAIDLILANEGVGLSLYFIGSDENVRKAVALPWVSFCSDEQSEAPEGVFLKIRPHPRAYGNFARLLGHFVREERVVPLEEAIRRLSALPAATLHLPDRGTLAEGKAADVVIFDPQTIADHATYDEPTRYATGVTGVLVNGVEVIRGGEHTGEKPGIIVRRAGYVKSAIPAGQSR